MAQNVESHEANASTNPYRSPVPIPGRSEPPLTRGQWLVLAAALLGWMFDGVEMGLFSAVGRPAVIDLLGSAAGDEKSVGQWVAYLTAWFLAGAAVGGLVFGWLGDRIGRVRSMAISILAYSLFTGACYFAVAPWQLAGLRFLASLGMGGEWALGVALVVECWPDRYRPLLAAVIGAAGNVGYLLIGGLVALFPVTPTHWRWTMLVCAAPALLALAVVAVLPESQRWKQSVERSTARPLSEIFTTRLIWPTLLGIALASVALIGTWGCVHAFMPTWADKLAGAANPYAKGQTLTAVSLGAILGGFVGPLLGRRLGRRPAYLMLCIASLVVCQVMFRTLDTFGPAFLLFAGVAGVCTASFYGWLPLYLPELFPTRVRATAQGVSYNAGRIFAAIGVLGTSQLLALFDGSYPRACATMSLVYIVGMAIIWLGPETKGRPLPE